MDRAQDQIVPASRPTGAGSPDALAAEVRSSRERIDTLVNAIADRARQSSVGATLESVRQMQDRVAEVSAEAAARWERLRTAAVRMPKERPLTMVAAVATVGFLLGLLVPRRH